MSKLFDDASLAMIPSAYKDGKLYSIRPIPEYGAELVTNGDFATDSNWNKGSGWTISGGKANASSATSDFTQTISYVLGKTYRITYTISNYSSGSVRTLLGAYIAGKTRSSNGTFTEDITPTNPSSNSFLYFEGISGFSASIDNVSVQEIVSSGDFTFSRGSNLAATRVDVNGLIEKGRENRVLYSNDFTNAAWIKFYTGVTAGQEDPFGGTNGTRLVSTGIGGYIYQNGVCISSSRMTASFWVKSNTGINQDFVFTANGGNQSSSAITATTSWQRVSFTFSSSSSGDILFGYQTTQLVDLLIYGFQLELGLVATDYIETGASTAQAGILEDMPRLDYSGSCPALLLEPQRTNLLPHSEYLNGWNTISAITIEANTDETLSPEGKYNAYKTTAIGGSTQRIYEPVSVAAGSITMSMYVKAGTEDQIRLMTTIQTFDIYYDLTNLTKTEVVGTGTIEAVGNDWYRISATGTTSGGTEVVQVRNLGDAGSSEYQYWYGIQVESASYPTSYIPTYGSSVTRSLENLSVSNIQTNNLIGSNQGSFVFHYKPYNAYTGSAGEIYDFRIDSNNRMATYFSNGTLRLFSNIAGATNFNQATTLDGDTEFKIGVGYDADSTLVYINGTLTYTLNGFDLGVTEFDIAPPANGSKVGDFSWFPTKLTATELAALTTL